MSAEQLVARRRIWRIVRTMPRAIRDVGTLRAALSQVLLAGFEAGRIRESSKIARMAAARRTPVRKSIEDALEAGKTAGQILRSVPGSKERTIKRIRAELKEAGRLQ